MQKNQELDQISEMLETLQQQEDDNAPMEAMVSAANECMHAAVDLTALILEKNKNQAMTTEEILDVYEKAFTKIISISPLREMLEESEEEAF
jgi:hypothetical protein